MEQIKTWQQAVDYTFLTRETWITGGGRDAALINTAHFTRLKGASFPVEKIRQPLMALVVAELKEEGKSLATINRIISAVSTVLKHCEFDELITDVAKFRRFQESEGRPFWYTKDEVRRMEQISRTVFMRDDMADLIMFAAYTGMRQSEILRLRKKDVDLTADIIHVGGVPGQVTKPKNYRAIPIHHHIAGIVSERCSQSSRSDIRIFGDEWRNKDQVMGMFEKVRDLIPKDRNYVFHTLRHSYATWLAEAGVPIRTIMTLCGHKRVETTLRYAKTSEPAAKAAVAAI